MRGYLVNLVALLALLAIPPAAAAQQAPPPDSELDQYVPNFPGAKGDKELGGGGEGDGGGGGQAGADPVLPAATQEELGSAGPAGKAAADFAEGSAPGGGDGGTSGKGAKADGQSSVSAIVGAALGGTSGGGIGVLLPLLLGAIAVGGILYVLRRRGVLGSSGRE
jgi:hypothetical protein